MGWQEVTTVSQRKEFVSLAAVQGANISLLCKRFGISRKTGYKWMSRYMPDNGDWPEDRSRRPQHSPLRIDSSMEALILLVRDERPSWGARKIRRRLEDLGHRGLPCASTITEVLRRNGRLSMFEPKSGSPMQRFEQACANELWQMDFKGPVKTLRGMCHPLVVVDDHSRYSVCVRACEDEKASTVKSTLVPVFRKYGLPARILTDNGASFCAPNSRYNYLSAWLIRMGISISHGRPYHPQTQGKVERLNRTLDVESVQGRNFSDLTDCQKAFDRFVYSYNYERPHEALDYAVPASRYRVSVFPYPEVLPDVSYPSGDFVRKVNAGGSVHFRSNFYPVGRAFRGEWVGLRTTDVDGVLDVYYCRQRVMVINRRTGEWMQT